VKNNGIGFKKKKRNRSVFKLNSGNAVVMMKLISLALNKNPIKRMFFAIIRVLPC